MSGRVTVAEQGLSPAWAERRVKLSRHIEEASIRCMLECGFDGVTVEDLAQAAAISRRSFYRYFPTPLAVLAALPRRSHERLIGVFSDRPISEGISLAFLNSFDAIDFSPEEVAIRELSEEVLRRWPEVWWNAVSGLQAESIRNYRLIISQRLIAMGRDTAHSGVLAATFSAVIGQVNMENRNGNPLARENIDKYRLAFHGLVELLGDC
jgi:AcrR family transcriptional regulator